MSMNTTCIRSIYWNLHAFDEGVGAFDAPQASTTNLCDDDLCDDSTEFTGSSRDTMAC